MPTKKQVQFDIAIAIDHAIGTIINNSMSTQEGVCDVVIEGHESDRLVATRGTVKTIKDAKTGNIVGELSRIAAGKRFEGELYGDKVVGLFTSRYDFYIWKQDKLAELGFRMSTPASIHNGM